jgi:5,10-methylenetetrahydromethanopterin reductase
VSGPAASGKIGLSIASHSGLPAARIGALADLPIYLAALGPRMLELAGRIADGVIFNLMTPAQANQAAGVVRAAARAAGRDPARQG